jgi:integrase
MRISKEGLGEVRLRDDEIAKIVELSRKNSQHYFFFELMMRRGFRISAITGDRVRMVKYAKQIKVKRPDGTIQLVQEEITKTYPPSHGIRKEDVTSEGVSVIWKGGEKNFRYLPSDLARELFAYASKLRKGQKVVGFTRQRGYQLCQEYAKQAGIRDWKRVHPHRFRHYFGTFHARRTGRDPWKVSSLMGHKDLRATRVYVEDLSPEEEKAELG